MVEVVPYLVMMIAVVFTVAAILVMPRRRYRTINFTLDINALRDRVWSLLVDAKGPGSWRPEVVEIRPHTADPDLVNHVCFYRGQRFTIVHRILVQVAGQSLVMRCEEIAGSFLPLGARAFAAVKISDSANGTRLSYREEGTFNSLLTYLLFRAAQRAAFGRLQRQAEAGTRAAEREAGWLVPSPALIAGSAIAAGLITTIAGWQVGLLVFAFLSIMEYGHAFVVRSQGGRPSFALLLPFVGGAMIMTRQKSSAFGEAVRALSGPAALSIVVVALSVVAAFMDSGGLADNTEVAAAIAAGIVVVFCAGRRPDYDSAIRSRSLPGKRSSRHRNEFFRRLGAVCIGRRKHCRTRTHVPVLLLGGCRNWRHNGNDHAAHLAVVRIPGYTV